MDERQEAEQRASDAARRTADDTNRVGDTEDEILAAADALGVQLPSSYTMFIGRSGSTRVADYRIFGAAGGAQSALVRKTMQERVQSELPPQYVVVGERGPNTLIVLDCSRRSGKGECPVALIPRGYDAVEEPNYVADTFGQFIDEPAESN